MLSVRCTRVRPLATAGENPGVRTNLARLLNYGRLGGTGKMVILPVPPVPPRALSKAPHAVLCAVYPNRGIERA
jgi:hypothetical protein